MDRCELTDLPADSCAHCTGRTGEGEAAHAAPGSSWIQAKYFGHCTGPCARRIKPGDQIRSDGQEGWLCTDCGQ